MVLNTTNTSKSPSTKRNGKIIYREQSTEESKQKQQFFLVSFSYSVFVCWVFVLFFKVLFIARETKEVLRIEVESVDLLHIMAMMFYPKKKWR